MFSGETKAEQHIIMNELQQLMCLPKPVRQRSLPGSPLFPHPCSCALVASRITTAAVEVACMQCVSIECLLLLLLPRKERKRADVATATELLDVVITGSCASCCGCLLFAVTTRHLQGSPSAKYMQKQTSDPLEAKAKNTSLPRLTVTVIVVRLFSTELKTRESRRESRATQEGIRLTCW